MKELLLCARTGTPALALVRDRRLLEYGELAEDLAFQAGAVYLGSAGRVMKGLKAVFVTLAPGVQGFLPFDEAVASGPPQPGDSVLVQIKKPAQGGKAAYLTQDIALPGRAAMLLPLGRHAHASKRVRDQQALRALARRLCPDGMGLVLRASAEDWPRDRVQAEIDAHLKTWADLQLKARASSAPALLMEAPGLLARLLRDERELPGLVVSDDEKAAAGLGLDVRLHPDPFGLYGVEQQLRQALARRVYLPSGGFLVLDPCEAALLIDVNSGQDSRKAGDLMLRVNLEAAAEIARLLRLRRAGGIILVDFIDMPDEKKRDLVRATLEDALREDRVVSEVLGFTKLGLLEMTRRKADAALRPGAVEDAPEEAPEVPGGTETDDA